MLKSVAVLLMVCSTILSCKKEKLENSCDELQSGVVANDISKVRSAINYFINDLDDKEYTEANINQLTNLISSNCNVTASVFCFDCIQTLPAQTEIRLSVNSGGTIITRTVDLSRGTGNKIEFVNMHD